MNFIFERARRLGRFVLAGILWLHALFLLHFEPPHFSWLALRLHLTASETIVFALLVALSLLTSYGIWRFLLDVLYIYLFPFVLLFLLAKYGFLLLLKLNRFLRSPGQSASLTVTAQETQASAEIQAAGGNSKRGPRARPTWSEIGRFLSRPFRKFTVLWCFLVLVTTHSLLLKIGLAIVLVHIAYKIATIFRITLFSADVMSKLEAAIGQSVDTLLAKIAFVTPDTEPTVELRGTWNGLSGMRAGLMFLQNPRFVSRWAVFLGVAYLGCIYGYLAFLFSFAYYGVARVQTLNYTWPDALVEALFIPFAYTDLPHNIWIKLVGGIHGTVVVLIGAGTILNYVIRKAQQLQRVAAVLSERFTEVDVRERLLILEQKLGAKPPSTG